MLDLHHVDPDEWETYRALRLEMLLDSPDAFFTTHAEALALDEATWRQRLTSAHHVMAVLDGRPCGAVGLWPGPEDGAPDEAHLVAMYVAPHARRRGVGERLVRAALEAAREQGRPRVLLEVTSSNTGALALYERMGFRLTGVRTPHPRRADLEELAMVRVAEGFPPPSPG